MMMTVRQLIEELQKLPDNIPVKIDTTGKKYKAVEVDSVTFEGNYVLLQGG